MDLSVDRVLGILGVIGIFVGLGVAVAMDPKSKGELEFSIGCFILSGFALSLTVGIATFKSDAVLLERFLISGLLFALICASMVEASRWAQGRYSKVGETAVAPKSEKKDDAHKEPPTPSGSVPAKPHLVMNSAFGSLNVQPFNSPGERDNPTVLQPYETTGNSCKVYVALTNTGAPATGGNLIILYDAKLTVKCENCVYNEYVWKPESVFAGITIPFELPDSRPKFITLLINGAYDSYTTLMFKANTHEVTKDISLGGAHIKVRGRQQ
jgi:hypothetical protein